MNNENIQILSVEFSEPFIHRSAMTGLWLYGAFSAERKVVKDFIDAQGRRHVRYVISSPNIVREIVLGDEDISEEKGIYRWSYEEVEDPIGIIQTRKVKKNINKDVKMNKEEVTRNEK